MVSVAMSTSLLPGCTRVRPIRMEQTEQLVREWVRRGRRGLKSGGSWSEDGRAEVVQRSHAQVTGWAPLARQSGRHRSSGRSRPTGLAPSVGAPLGSVRAGRRRHRCSRRKSNGRPRKRRVSASARVAPPHYCDHRLSRPCVRGRSRVSHGDSGAPWTGRREKRARDVVLGCRLGARTSPSLVNGNGYQYTASQSPVNRTPLPGAEPGRHHRRSRLQSCRMFWHAPNRRGSVAQGRNAQRRSKTCGRGRH